MFKSLFKRVQINIEVQTDYNCYLYNGSSKIPGVIHLNTEFLTFTVRGFEHTNLNLKLAYTSISNVNNYKIFNIETAGLSILDIHGTKIIFILDDHLFLYTQLQILINSNQ